MTQPLDRTCKLPQLGAVDEAAGEFWVENPFLIPSIGANLSAYERNRMFLNVDGSSFLNVSYASAADIDSDSRSVISADFDQDGAPDLLVGSVGGGPLRLFANRFPPGNRRVRIELIGITSNRYGIGTRLTAHCGSRQIVRDLFPPNGFMGQGPVSLELGVGPIERIDRLSLRWPNGSVQDLSDLPVDCSLAIVEGRSDYTVSPLARRN